MTKEAELLKRAKAYDPVALAELYDRYAPKMYTYIYRRVSGAALAEDLTSELFLRMLQAIRNEQVWRDSFVAWPYRIAHNLVVDHYRRQPAAPSVSLGEALVASGDDPVATTENGMARERLRAAISCLTPEQQEVLALRYGEGMTAREAAQVLQKTPGAVEALKHRGVAALRRILARGESL